MANVVYIEDDNAVNHIVDVIHIQFVLFNAIRYILHINKTLLVFVLRSDGKSLQQILSTCKHLSESIAFAPPSDDTAAASVGLKIMNKNCPNIVTITILTAILVERLTNSR